MKSNSAKPKAKQRLTTENTSASFERSTQNVERSTQNAERITLNRDDNLAQIVEKYPELIEVLTFEYGLHCTNCIFSDFDTLAEGAAIHGIEGEELEDMIEHLEEIINKVSKP